MKNQLQQKLEQESNYKLYYQVYKILIIMIIETACTSAEYMQQALNH